MTKWSDKTLKTICELREVEDDITTSDLQGIAMSLALEESGMSFEAMNRHERMALMATSDEILREIHYPEYSDIKCERRRR